MSSQAQPRVYSAGDEVVPGYVLVERLGKGMSGDVWIAQGPGRTRVALKIVRTLSKLGGRKELAALQTIRNINHTNLCPLHGFWLKDRDGNLIAEADEESWVKDETTRLAVGPSSSEPARATVPVRGISRTRRKLDVEGDQAGQETDQPVLDETTTITEQLGFGFESTGKPGSKSTVLPGSFPKAVSVSTSSFDSTRVPRTAPASELWRQAEELIVVMGLGDCTLFDELQKVRRAAGIAPKDRTTVLGLPPEEIVRYVRESASAIDLLNITHRIFHRDIKPQNILIVSGGAQVCDFGLAHKMDADSTATQQVMATPVYAPPELLDNRMVDKSVDQYCLAVTAFELRTGTLPFDATSMSKIVLAKCENRFTLDAVPVSERAVYLRALHVDPAKRFSNCREMVDALAIAMGVDHVEKSSTKSVVWAAALIFALVVAPLVVYAYNVTASSGSSADLVALASQQYESMPSGQETLLARDSLRSVLEKLLDASESGGGADPSIQSLAKVVTADFSNRLDVLSERSDQFDGNGFELLGQDDALLSRTIDGERPTLFPSDLPHAESLRSGIVLRRALTQTAEEFKSPSVADATGLISELRSRLEEHPESFNSGQTRNAALLIALSHRPLAETQSGLAAVEPLDDLVRAQKAVEVDTSAIDEIPSWLRQPWSDLRDSGKDQLASAIRNGKLDDAARDKVLQTWPDLFIDAKLISIEKALVERRWNDADREGQSLLTIEGGWTKETETRRQLFLRLHPSLKEPQKMSETMAWITKQVDKLPPFSSQTKLALANWWTETSHRWFIGQTPPTAESIASTVKDSIGFSKILHRSVPADVQSAQLCDWIATPELQLDKESLVTWIQQTVDEDENTDAMNRLMWLRSAISIDHSVESSTRDDGGAKTLQDVVAVESITDRLPFGYADFVLGIANLKEGDSSAAMTAWSRLKVEEARQALGVRRAVVLAEGWLGLAVGSSEIDDREPIRVRYMDVSQTDIPMVVNSLSSAQWWAQGVGNRVDKNFRFSVWLENWLVRAAHRSGDLPTKLPQFDRQAFGTLVLNKNQFEATDGQLVAGSFSLARWVMEKPETIDPKEKGWWLDLLVTSADAAIQLHESRGEQVTDAIMESHVVPVAESILNEVSQQPTNQNSRISNILVRFNDKLQDPGITDRKKVEDFRRQKVEVLTEIALRSDKNSAVDRWLELGEQTRQYVGADGSVWTTEKLDELRGFLDRAKNADAETGKRYLLLDAFELAMRAMAEPDRNQRISLCQQSADRYAKLIEELRQSKSNAESARLYEALWRRADLLVNLAFFDDSSNKCASLREAHRNADEAVKMFDRVQWESPPELNMPLGARGNSLEDLAFYKCESDPKRQHETYQQAESSFESAIQLTELAYDKGIRNRFGLARCITRHIEQCGVLVSDRDNKLAHAMRQLGEPPSDSQIPAIHRMEWHIWASRVRFLQNNFEDAIAQARTAVEIGENEKLSAQHCNLSYYTLANLLSRKEAGSGLENNPLAMEMLDKIESPDDSMFWRCSEIRLDIIAERLKTFADLPKFLEESELIKRISDGMERAPSETMKVVGLAGRYLKLASDTTPGGSPSQVTSAYASQKLDEMQKELAAFPAAKTTLAYLKCYHDVVANATPTEQVRDWALALQAGEVDSRTRTDTQELIVIQSMSWLKNQQFNGAFGPVAAPDRKLVADSVNQWALRRPAEEQAPMKLRKLISSIEDGKF